MANRSRGEGGQSMRGLLGLGRWESELGKLEARLEGEITRSEARLRTELQALAGPIQELKAAVARIEAALSGSARAEKPVAKKSPAKKSPAKKAPAAKKAT